MRIIWSIVEHGSLGKFLLFFFGEGVREEIWGELEMQPEKGESGGSTLEKKECWV